MAALKRPNLKRHRPEKQKSLNRGRHYLKAVLLLSMFGEAAKAADTGIGKNDDCTPRPIFMNIDARSTPGDVSVSFGEQRGTRHYYKTTIYPFRSGDIKHQQSLSLPNNGFTLSIKLNSAYPSTMDRNSGGSYAYPGPEIIVTPTSGRATSGRTTSGGTTSGGDCSLGGQMVARQPWTPARRIKSPALKEGCAWIIPPAVTFKGCIADPGNLYDVDMTSQKVGGISFFLDDGTILNKTWFHNGNIPKGSPSYQAITSIRATSVGSTLYGAAGLTVKQLTSPLTQHYKLSIDLDKETPPPRGDK